MLIFVLGKFSFRSGASLGKFIGAIWFFLDKTRKNIAIDNLSRAYGPEKSKNEILQLARRVFDNLGRMLFEYAWFYSSGSKHDSGIFSVKGFNHLEAAHAKKKGVLLLSAHLGNWEFGTALAPLTGMPITVVYQKIKFKPLDLLIKNNRKKLGITLLPLHNAFAGVDSALKRGDLIGLLMDQNTRHKKGIFIDFFGRKTSANPGLAKLALQTGAPVIPAFAYRENGKYIFEIQPELPLIKTGDEKTDILLNTQQQNTVIEKIVRRHPDQWFWIHKRWKTRPLDEQESA